jgi:hypothetical protein
MGWWTSRFTVARSMNPIRSATVAWGFWTGVSIAIAVVYAVLSGVAQVLLP